MNNKVWLFIWVFSILAKTAFSVSTDYMAELDDAIKNKSKYTHQKEEYIKALKFSLKRTNTILQRYEINKNLFKTYQKFNLDSAVTYANKNITIASSINDIYRLKESQIQLANAYSSSGRSLESEKILYELNNLPKDLKASYYDACIQFYEHYIVNNYADTYKDKIIAYRDSLLKELNPVSLAYRINLSRQQMAKNDLNNAEKKLLELFDGRQEKDADYAMIAYLLADIYKRTAKDDLEKRYNALSAIADIKNAIKDNAAIQNLALFYLNKGDLDLAYRFTKSAIEDAIFCKVQFRTVQMSEVYSIINTAYLEKEASQKRQLKTYLISISVLTVFLFVAIAYVYKQMRKVSRIKEELRLSADRLKELNMAMQQTNEELNEINSQLSESNHVKEEYIAHFFDLCSSYINKLENYRKTLNKKVSEKQIDELFKILRSTEMVDHELDELYKNFDTIFLNLYPTFVKDFNALLIPEEQVVLKQGELLNTELRIFALIRLGISDSVKIAAFLRYSISTIYNYRTKARNKAAVSRDSFENLLTKIGNLQINKV